MALSTTATHKTKSFKMLTNKIIKLRIFLLLTILVNISHAKILQDPLTTVFPTQDLNEDTEVPLKFDEDNLVEVTTDTATTTVIENETTESVMEASTNKIECVCDCMANGKPVSVGCTTHSPEGAETETTKNSLVNESATSKNEENLENLNNTESISELNPVDSLTTTPAPPPICHTPGLQAHEFDCHQYYNCSMEGSQDGNLHLIIKSCPEKQAFNSELNRCSRDISSCPLDIQCLRKETIPDFVTNSYYLCEPRLVDNGFRIFRVHCSANEIYLLTEKKCYPDLDSLLFYDWSTPKDIDVVKAEIKLLKKQDKLKLKEAKKKAKQEEKINKIKAKQEAISFLCVQEGNFPSQVSNSYYITCINKKEKLNAISKRCGSGGTFYPTLSNCVYTVRDDSSSDTD